MSLALGFFPQLLALQRHLPMRHCESAALYRLGSLDPRH
jgi:hypothetical protein